MCILKKNRSKIWQTRGLTNICFCTHNMNSIPFSVFTVYIVNCQQRSAQATVQNIYIHCKMSNSKRYIKGIR